VPSFALNLAVWSLLLSTLPGHAYQAETVTGGGVVRGTVTYSGRGVAPAPLQVTKDREVCGSARLYDRSLVVGHDGGIADAVITINNISTGEPMKPEVAVKFDQKGCEYIPHVAVFPAGSTVAILNSDGILHNVHTESRINPVVDVAQPGFKKQIDLKLEKPETIKVTCDAHNWMEGWWYVTANPYYAKSDTGGHYTIRNVPPGTYTLQAWQERLGTESQRITVRPGMTTTANFVLRPHGS